MSHDIFKPSNLIGCLENKTADSAQTRKCAIVTRPFPSPGGRGLGTRLGIEWLYCISSIITGSITHTLSAVHMVCAFSTFSPGSVHYMHVYFIAAL